MKRILILILCFALSCQQVENSETTTVTILIDVTDAMSFPTPNQIAEYIEKRMYLHGKTTVRICTIYEYEPSAAIEFTLESEIMLLSNTLVRKARVKEFLAKVTTQIDSIYRTQTKRQNSTVIAAVAGECTNLSKQPGKQYMVILSDLGENSSNLNVYALNMTDSTQLETVRTAIDKSATMPELSNTTVTFVYLPKDIISNDRFTALTKIYKTILTAKGAKVTVEAILTTNRFANES